MTEIGNTIDWKEGSITYQSFGEDERGFCIIAWLLDFARRLNEIGPQKINTIACSKLSREGIIDAYTEWNVSIPEGKKDEQYNKEYQRFRSRCTTADAISLDGKWLRFELIEGDDKIYLKTLAYDEPVKRIERKPIALRYYQTFLTELIEGNDVSSFFDEIE